VQESYLTHVGKEANKFEEVEAGLEQDPEVIYTEYHDPRRDTWRTLVLPVLKQMPIENLVAATGLHRRSLFALRSGERLPHPRNRGALISTTSQFARQKLSEQGIAPSCDNFISLAKFSDNIRILSTGPVKNPRVRDP
jgi:hypothetical protein